MMLVVVLAAGPRRRGHEKVRADPWGVVRLLAADGGRWRQAVPVEVLLVRTARRVVMSL